MPEKSAGSGRIVRSVLAVLGGLAAIFALSIGTDVALEKSGLVPPPAEQPQHPEAFYFFFAYRFVYGIIGGFITAKLAPYAPIGHALALGAVGFILSAAGAVAMWNFGPHWFSVALVVVAIPCAWLGGRLAGRQPA